MLLVVMSIQAAVEANTPLTEWHQILSTPAASNKVFSHLAMESEVTALCGGIIVLRI